MRQATHEADHPSPLGALAGGWQRSASIPRPLPTWRPTSRPLSLGACERGVPPAAEVGWLAVYHQQGFRWREPYESTRAAPGWRARDLREDVSVRPAKPARRVDQDARGMDGPA